MAIFGLTPFTTVARHARLQLTAPERILLMPNAGQIWDFVWCRNNGRTGQCPIRPSDYEERLLRLSQKTAIENFFIQYDSKLLNREIIYGFKIRVNSTLATTEGAIKNTKKTKGVP